MNGLFVNERKQCISATAARGSWDRSAFFGRQVVRVRGQLFHKRVLRPLAATYLEGQQRTKFSPTGAAVGVMMSNLAVSWFLVEGFLEAFRRLWRLVLALISCVTGESTLPGPQFVHLQNETFFTPSC